MHPLMQKHLNGNVLLLLAMPEIQFAVLKLPNNPSSQEKSAKREAQYV